MARILIVDDSLAIRRPLELILIELGHHPFAFEDGKRALDFARKESVELVITDINMPVLDGFTLVASLRRLELYKNIPILMLTTESSDDKKTKAKRLGATGWITKPFTLERLKAALKKTLG
jgi:two-component system chemotaxis response regulator CheY